MNRSVIIAVALAVAGCSSSTSIRVSDPEARIFVNGEYVGTGHGRYTDRKPAFTRQEVALRRDGCEEQTYSFRRNERPDVGAIVSAYYLVLPILWMTQYKEQHGYEFECDQIVGGVMPELAAPGSIVESASPN